ncbi:hypothetical protein BGZ47_003661 [Haplosporangium gracile]|nr:hypothetical protein BGZ47_003661 [Haplosporangium gracile]
MRWSTVSGPFLCLSSALTLLQAVANAQDVGSSQPNFKSRPGVEPGVGTGAAAVALGLADFSAEAIMGPLSHAPVYSSPKNKPTQQNIQSDSNANNDNIVDSIVNNNSNDDYSSGREVLPQSAKTDPRGGSLADDGIAKLQKWIDSHKSPQKIGGDLDGEPISYDLIKVCLDIDFGFPAEVPQNTVDTVKSLISSFYVFEDLSAHPPRDISVQHLSFQPVELIKEIDAWFEQSKVSAIATDDK